MQLPIAQSKNPRLRDTWLGRACTEMLIREEGKQGPLV